MIDFLKEHVAKKPVSFHMPGHKGAEFFRKYGYGKEISRLVDWDITEIAGADNLFQPKGIILETQKRYARLYDVAHSYLLVNGTSGGLMAAVMAAAPRGSSIIVARNCHKSIINGLILGGIQPVYAYPQVDSIWGICSQVSVEEIQRCLEQCPEAKAVVLPSPNYYGICSDIEAIVKLVHSYNKILIVDQAHGAHLHFLKKYTSEDGESLPDLPPSAESCGADIVVNSTHKTLASLTQSAVLNLQGERVNRLVLEERLSRVESTSPSYILMAMLEINRRIIEEYGKVIFSAWKENLLEFYAQAKEISQLKVMEPARLFDWTKINMAVGGVAADGATDNSMVDGRLLDKALRGKNIFSELYTGDLVMCMTGIGTTTDDLNKLLAGLKDICDHRATGSTGNHNTAPISHGNPCTERINMAAQITGAGVGQVHSIPQETQYVSMEEAAGKICAGAVIPYPPGIPLCCPGEVITEDVMGVCKDMRSRGEKVMGITDTNEVLVGKE